MNCDSWAKNIDYYRACYGLGGLPASSMLAHTQALGCTRLTVLKPLCSVGEMCHVNWKTPIPAAVQFMPACPRGKRLSCCHIPHPDECQETKPTRASWREGPVLKKSPSRQQRKQQRLSLNLKRGDKLHLLIKQ